MIIDVVLQEQHLARLKELVFTDRAVEGAAYVLFGISHVREDPWIRQGRTRFLSYEVVPVPAGDIESAAVDHITWSTASFVRLLKRAKDDNLVAGIVHSHPNGPASFSDQDCDNERELFRMACNRNGAQSMLLSVIITGDGTILAQAWQGGPHQLQAAAVNVVGKRFTSHARKALSPSPVMDRQAPVFGGAVNSQLRGLRVGVVGCGGTGSAVAMLLARLGVGQIVLIDDDIVEQTNLNRLHGARQSDADAMRSKVDVLAGEIALLGIGVRAVPIRRWVGDEACRDALKSCDIVFGCTDDHDGRLLLNRFAFFYLIPVIDVGLAIIPKAEDGSRVQELSGRCTVLAPGGACLICRGIVDPVVAREEDLRRRSPHEFERQKREAYVQQGGNPAPAVVTFTTATASMAVDELLDGLSDFRGLGGWTWQRSRRFDLMTDRQPGAAASRECAICTDQYYWGLGDVDPFLDRTG